MQRTKIEWIVNLDGTKGIVPKTTAMEVLGRWEKEYKINGEGGIR